MSTPEAKWVELSSADAAWIEAKDKELYAAARAASGGDYFSIRAAESTGYPGKVDVKRYLEVGTVGHEYIEAKALYDKMNADMAASGKPIYGNALFSGYKQSRYIQACQKAEIKSLDVNSVSDDMLPPGLAAEKRKTLATNNSYTSVGSGVGPITNSDPLNQQQAEERASKEVSLRLKKNDTPVGILLDTIRLRSEIQKEVGLAFLSGDSLQIAHTKLMLKDVTARMEKPKPSPTTELSL